MPLPGDINGLKQELLACTAAAKHASSVQVCKRLDNAHHRIWPLHIRIGHTSASWRLVTPATVQTNDAALPGTLATVLPEAFCTLLHSQVQRCMFA